MAGHKATEWRTSKINQSSLCHRFYYQHKIFRFVVTSSAAVVWLVEMSFKDQKPAAKEEESCCSFKVINDTKA